MKTYAIVNVSRKGLWPENENVTLVRAESREEIIKTILRGQDSFVERRLTPCHEYLRNLFKKFRGEAISEEEDELGEQVEEVEKRKESQLKEDQMAKRILKEIDSGEINDSGFFTQIQECEEIHELQCSSRKRPREASKDTASADAQTPA